MRVTQQDIARFANVSQATVSRVLAGDERVEGAIKTRVLSVMAEHNYKPDVRARSLRKQKTHLIGLVLKREAREIQGDPFFSVFLAEILGFLAGTPYHLCVDIASSSTGQSHIYDELLRTQRVDGLILVESEVSDERVRLLEEDRFPFVLIGNPNGDDHLISVDNDNVLAGRMATEHLLEQGFQRVGFIAGPQAVMVSRDRVQGYMDAIAEHGQEPLVWYCDFGLDSARDASFRALTESNRPDALVVMDDYMAMGVVQSARELHLSIPSQLALVSFNDTSLCDVVENGLTSVSLNIPTMVQRAVGRLMRVIEQEKLIGERRLIVPCELKVRGSSRRTPEVTLA